MVLKIGEVVDVLDTHDVYCPAVIKKIVSKSSVFVSYIGWGEEWDEVITDMSRITRNKTVLAKAWVKLSRTFCLWPCVVYIRRPLDGSKDGENYLKEEEQRCYVVPCGESKPPLKPYKHGVWMLASHISPLSKNYEARVADGNKSIHKVHFSASLAELESDSMSVRRKFRFDGSLEVGDKDTTATKRIKVEGQSEEGSHHSSSSSSSSSSSAAAPAVVTEEEQVLEEIVEVLPPILSPTAVSAVVQVLKRIETFTKPSALSSTAGVVDLSDVFSWKMSYFHLPTPIFIESKHSKNVSVTGGSAVIGRSSSKLETKRKRSVNSSIS